MKRAVVVGSGAGGAAAAKSLQGAFHVTILESGGDFRPFPVDPAKLEKWRKTGLFFDERLIRVLFPAMRIKKTPDGMVMVFGSGTGGTSAISTGNAMRVDGGLKKLGIDLDTEFGELEREVPVSTSHQKRWSATTRRLFELCESAGLRPRPTPKMGEYDRCTGCGRCIFGCPSGVKWDSRRFLAEAVSEGADLATNCAAKRVVVSNGRAEGVIARQGVRSRFFPADLVVLSAGGFSTPVILNDSGYPCEERLFVDPVLCVAARIEGCAQNREIPMPFVVQRDGYIVSPYFDYLSFFFDRRWRHPSGNIYSIMIKLADTNQGAVRGRRIVKTLTDKDREKLDEAVELCAGLLGGLGVRRRDIFLGRINAGHPGGTMPLTAEEASSLHHSRLPENLYIADATLLPGPLGNPPIFTIMALAKRVSKMCIRGGSGQTATGASAGSRPIAKGRK